MARDDLDAAGRGARAPESGGASVIDASLDADFAEALANGQFGFGLADERLVVIERLGALAGWMAEAGRPIGSSAILFGMEDALAELAAANAAPLTLPSIQMANLAAARVSISIAWNAATRRYIILTFPDVGARQLDRLVANERRERRMLQQQAAAAAARVAISETLYRDIVETTGDAVLRLKPDLSVAFINGAAGHLIGIDANRALGRPIGEILPLPLTDNPWKPELCASGSASFEQPARNRAGGALWLWWDVRWIGEDDGPAEFQAIGRDITESRRLRAQVERRA
jgi:PAS domain S-box-containing protein